MTKKVYGEELAQRKNDILDLYKAGKTYREMGPIIGIPTRNIQRHIRILAKDPKNGIIPRRIFIKDDYGIRLECPTCKGLKKVKDVACKDCFDDGINESTGVGMFYYEAERNRINPITRRKDTRHLIDFTKYLGLTNVQDLADWFKVKKTPEENYIYFEKRVGGGYVTQELRDRRRLQSSTQRSMVSSIKNAYDMNREKGIPWERIRKYIKQPQGLTKPEFDAYTPNQIKVFYNNSDTRYKAVTSWFMAGGRVGGIHEPIFEHFLKIGDLSDPMEEFDDEQKKLLRLKIPDYDESPVYQMKIYAQDVDPDGKIDQYICWTTPECRDLIDQMLAQRQKDGELGNELRDKPYSIKNFPKEAPVFRKHYNPEPDRHKYNPRRPGHEYTEAEKQEKEEKRTYELTHPKYLDQNDLDSYFAARRDRYLEPMPKRVKMFNGFRSYVYSVMLHEAHIPEKEIYWFQGRDLGGIGDAYDKWGIVDRLATFWRAMPFLTIDKEKYLRGIIKEKEGQIKSLKLDEDHRKEFEWSVHHVSNQAINMTIRNEQGLEMLNSMLLSILTPDQKEAMMKQFPQLASTLPSPQPPVSSSLPLENKIIPIDKKDDIIKSAATTTTTTNESGSESTSGNNEATTGSKREQETPNGDES